MGLNSSSSARLYQEVATPIDLQFKDKKEHYDGRHIAHGLGATVYRALILHPKVGDSYPFTKPKHETPLLLGFSASLVWESETLEVIPLFHLLLCVDNSYRVSFYPISRCKRVRSESPVRFTRKRTKRGRVRGKATDKPSFTRLSTKPGFYRVRELYYGLGRC
ncbi:hypothetical protein LguiB_012601 [Lonicera macranthoides]